MIVIIIRIFMKALETCIVAKEPLLKLRQRPVRLKLWELPAHYHCAIIGTCLTVAELQKTARQSKVPAAATLADYELHTLMVHQAAKKEGAGRNLHKQLDRKYHHWIKQLHTSNADDFAGYWDQAVEGWGYRRPVLGPDDPSANTGCVSDPYSAASAYAVPSAGALPPMPRYAATAICNSR